MITYMKRRVRHIRTGGFALLLWLGIASGAVGQTAAGSMGTNAAPDVRLSRAEEVIVQPGDVLRIHIWPDNALGGEFPVEETGLVHLPILGEVQAGQVVRHPRRILQGQIEPGNLAVPGQEHRTGQIGVGKIYIAQQAAAENVVDAYPTWIRTRFLLRAVRYALTGSLWSGAARRGVAPR